MMDKKTSKKIDDAVSEIRIALYNATLKITDEVNEKSKQGLYRPSTIDGSIWIDRKRRNELNGCLGADFLLVRPVCRNEEKYNINSRKA